MADSKMRIFDYVDQLNELVEKGTKVPLSNRVMLDRQELKQLLQMHERATGSGKAKEILDAFDHYLPLFKAVISDEYLSILKGA